MATLRQEDVDAIIRKELEHLGYDNLYDDHTKRVTTWCGRDRHDDIPNFVVYVRYRGQKEPFCIIEAKSSDENINDERHVNQARSYALWLKGVIMPITPFFILFNGKEACLYNTITGSPLKYGPSLKDVMPSPEEAEKKIDQIIDVLDKAGLLNDEGG